MEGASASAPAPSPATEAAAGGKTALEAVLEACQGLSDAELHALKKRMDKLAGERAENWEGKGAPMTDIQCSS
eukprot:SAG22_NODE_315_length_12535_cov_3.240351_9_plen_73_part_00